MTWSRIRSTEQTRRGCGVYTPLATYDKCSGQHALTTQLYICEADQLLALANNLTTIDIAWRIPLSGRTPAESGLANKLIGYRDSN
jgi:hypothetical protein